MRKPSNLGWKLLFLLLCMGFLLMWLLLDLPCIVRHFTGLICPSCGMSRAWLAALRLDLVQAFYYHPVFWSIPLFVLFIFYDGRLFQKPRVNAWAFGGLLGLFFLCYFIRLWAFLGGFLSI